jgi:hypothetical protein
MLRRLFTAHPASVGESYFTHLAHALGFAARMFLGSLACLVHAVFPFLCVKTGSRCITDLHDRMVANRDRRPRPVRMPDARSAW